MDCEALLLDVEAYIASLDADGWKESIQAAIEHSSDEKDFLTEE